MTSLTLHPVLETPIDPEGSKYVSNLKDVDNDDHHHDDELK